MTKKIAAANWKMNLNLKEAIQLAGEIAEGFSQRTAKCEVILAPSFPFLAAVAQIAREKKHIHVAAQDCSAQPKGAFTGEVAAYQIKSAGADYVIIGHSERRTCHQEKSALLLQKIKQAFANELNVIFCCGETLEERNSNRHFTTVKQQLEETIFQLLPEELNKLIIAYEPVWAIGTGVNASAAQAQEMHQYIRNELKNKFGTVADKLSVLYGGSCNEKNAAELFSQPDIDGGLIGGASLKAESFLAIVDAFR